ncbi:carbonic anhydrase [Dichomitus squalens]|uniref:Carbonic anhydrase n=1 Tax=Dichomitus squalens TaxID=114155 RepID=A0A4Q9Q7F4_9APHY|nr:carbonic anhydrase [Dichomitus squalens]
MATLTVADLLARNKASLASYQPRPYLSDRAALNIPPPSSVLVTCCDPRVHPEEFFGHKSGDAAVLRNAGGRVRLSLIDIITLDALLGHGTLKQLLIMHHTDCGATHFKDEDLKADTIARHPERRAEIEAWPPISFHDKTIAESVKEDIEAAQQSELLPEALKKGVRGFVLDIKTGVVTEV